MIQTKVIKNALVYYDDRYPNRIIDAVGSNVVKWELPVAPPMDASSYPAGMVTTETNVGTIIASTTPGDRLIITTDTAAYDGYNLQALGSAFQIAAGKPCYFGARVSMQNGVGKGDYLIGLCEVDTALLATSSAHALAVADDGIYFYQLQGATSMIFVNELGGVEGAIASGVTTGSATKHDLELWYDGTTLYVYVDGTEIGSVTAGLADQALTPSINVRAGDDGAEIMYIEWMKAIQIR